MSFTTSQVNPLLQWEQSAHHPVTSVSAILQLMRQAEAGNLISQAELFNDMEELDAHIYAEITKRKMAVAQLDWCVEPTRIAGAKETKQTKQIEDFIRDNVDMETLVFDMSSAIGFGFACLEIEWKRDPFTGWWVPAPVARPQRWFTVDRATRQIIRLRNMSSPDGDDLVENGWIVHRHSAKTGYPATQGLYRSLVLPYVFKNLAVKNWLQFCERYGKAFLAMVHHESDPDQRSSLLTALQNMGANGAALLDGTKGDDLKMLNVTQGEGQGFMSLIEWCESSVSKAVLGGTLTSQSGKNGNYATAAVHDNVRMQIRDHDAKQIAATITQQLVRAICNVNGLTITPSFTFDVQQPEDLALMADAIPKLVQVGAKIPVQYLHDKLKIPMPEDGEEVLGGSAPGQGLSGGNASKDMKIAQAESMAAIGHACLSGEGATFTPQQQAIEALADTLLARMSSPVDPKLIATAIRGAKDPQDLEHRLAAVLTKTDLSEWTRILERALFAADVMGYAHA